MKLLNILAILIVLTATAATCEKSTAEECLETAKADCMCTMQYDPVCGCNKKTYGNACEAGCYGIKSYVKGECPK